MQREAPVARPTDRQLAFLLDMIDHGKTTPQNPTLRKEVDEALRRATEWLRAQVPMGARDAVLAVLDSCECGAALKLIEGNLECPHCRPSTPA